MAECERHPARAATLVSMGTSVLSLRIDGELLERLRDHAAKRGMSVQDYVVRTLIRDDFDERFQTAVDETEKFYGVT
ncbi:putative DNA binding CopG/RHH family protein [Streptomyces canus]|uniref:ribbon-helix-helix protein, CopG family n=1 Tax=unclassified Streptomyces TaxID=2593676 RepID=UPI000F6537D7|nr:ribbon-helix-helix protein, CopG family [Streptomyces sp. RP5T]RRR78698.1 ribbon-helix-helix protein, CopG family [Streptomyces sp. RP5T]